MDFELTGTEEDILSAALAADVPVTSSFKSYLVCAVVYEKINRERAARFARWDTAPCPSIDIAYALAGRLNVVSEETALAIIQKYGNPDILAHRPASTPNLPLFHQ